MLFARGRGWAPAGSTGISTPPDRWRDHDRHPRHHRRAGAADLLAYRGVTVLLLAPLLALLAVLAGEAPLLASYTQIFMGALGGFIVTVLPAVPARRGLRQADGGLRLGRARSRDASSARLGADPRDPRRGAGLRGADLWRRVAVRRGLRGLSRSPPPLFRAGGHAQAPDPGHHRAWRLHLHHDRPARHAGDPERDPDALSSAPRRSPRRASA